MEAGDGRAANVRTASPSGVLFVDKPGGITSHGVVARVRHGLATRRVGHAGTLDPMATGLLVLGVGASTRLLTWITGVDKSYRATVRLGSASSTDDAEGELGPVAAPERLAAIDDAAIGRAVTALTGEIHQRPSSVSAIKVDGKRAYARVRSGEQVVLEPRAVTVARFDIVSINRAESAIDVGVVVDCSSGTYIRALARDLGEALGVGGHLTALRRTRVGPFSLASAVSIDADFSSALVEPATVASALMPVVTLTAQQSIDLAHGKRISLAEPDADRVAALSPQGRLISLVSVADGTARVLMNFPQDEGAA